MSPRFRPLVAIGMAAVLLSAASAQETPNELADELIRQEHARQEVEDAVRRTIQRFESGDEKIEAFVETAYELQSLGDTAVDPLITELRRADYDTFMFAAYALALIGTPEAETALREALAQADTQSTNWSTVRKAWAAYALGLMGRVDAIVLVNSGRLLSGQFEVHGSTSAVEAIAMQTIPECVPVLISELQRLTQTGPQLVARQSVIKALGRVGDPAAVPPLVFLLKSDRAQIRYEVAIALGRLGTREALAALVDLYADEAMTVRDIASIVLEGRFPVERLPVLLERLEQETVPLIRGTLYRTLANLGGASQLETLKKYVGRPDPEDRAALAGALGRVEDPGVFDLLRSALADPISDVAHAAIRALGEFDSPQVNELLLRMVDSTNWNLAKSAMHTLFRRNETKGAAAALQRLLLVEIPRAPEDPHGASRIESILEGLIGVRYVEALEELRPQVEKVYGLRMKELLRSALTRLDLLKANGKNVERWIPLLDSDDEKVRLLTYERLGEIGDDAAVDALVSAFGRVDPREGKAILRVLGRVDAAASRKLIARVLLAPEFDPIGIIELREMAAWAARNLGGQDMLDALMASAERRNGREARVLVYAALLGGEKVLPLLARLRTVRLRYLKWTRGAELDSLDEVARRIVEARSLADFDVPPDELRFR